MKSEQALLSSILLLGRIPAEIVGMIRPADLFDPLHQRILSAMLGLDRRGTPIDDLLLMEELRSDGKGEPVAYPILNELAKAAPHAGHVTFYAEEVRKHAQRRRLALIASEILDDVDRGRDPADILRVMDGFGAQQRATEAITYRAYTGTQLAKGTFPLTYLIDDVYVDGQPLIIGGGKKTLKTTILLDLGVSLTTGTPFLGRFAVNQTVRVAVMSGESGEATIQETCARICRAKGVELNDDIVLSPDLPHIEDPAHLRALRSFIRYHQTTVMILDPAYLCMSGDDAASLFKNGAILRRLNDACRQEGAGLILAHHARKKANGRGADQFTPPELDDLSWAGFPEWARQWILLGRRQKFDPRNSGQHDLWCTFGGSAGHSSLWAVTVDEGVRSDVGGRRWDVAVQTPDDAEQGAQQQRQDGRQEKREKKDLAKVQEARDAIIAAFRSLPGNEGTKSAIQDRAGKKGLAFNEAWAALLREKRIEECQVSKVNGQKYAGFRYIVDD